MRTLINDHTPDDDGDGPDEGAPGAVPELSLSEPAAGPDGRWLVLGMVTSVDGGTDVGGTSRGLGGDGDLAAFRAVRALADVVLVGAGTAVAEGYRATWVARDVDARRARGQDPLPQLAIVTGSGRLPADLPALDDPQRPPIVLTSRAGRAALPAAVAAAVRTVVVPTDGSGRLDMVAALDTLAERGLRRVVAEGGPTLNGALVGAGVVDELFVTVAPTLLGGDGPGLAGVLDAPRPLVLAELRVHGSELLCRYRLADDVTAEDLPDEQEPSQ